jgi:hypothetical protein
VLQSGDLVPHFVVHDLAGHALSYADTLWQRRNLVLLTLPRHRTTLDVAYCDELARHAGAFESIDTTVVITRDDVAGLDACAAVVCDRWGEVAWVCRAAGVEGLPPIEELIEWAGYVQRQCPECQGETR